MSTSIAIAVPIGAFHPLLRDCLASLAAQASKPVVSVLDASNDPRTAAVIDEFSSMIAYRRAGKDGGQTAAILEGWAHAPGDILGWLNADDALYPQSLSLVAVSFRDHPDTDVLYGHSVIINDNFETVGYHWAVEPPSEAILSGCIISQPSCFFRRKAYEAAGGLDASLHYTMDWDLWTRLWTSGAKFRFEDAVLSRVLWSREAKTGGFGPARRRELNRIIDAHNPPLRRLKSRFGFGLHHLLEYVAPRSLADTVRGARGDGARTIRGVGRNGALTGEAELPIAYYGPAPAQSVTVHMEVAQGFWTVMAGDSEAVATASGETVLPVKTSPGQTTTVRLRGSSGAAARLKSVRLA